MPTEITNSKFRLSKMGGSTEVVLFAHGSWCTANGKMYVPKGMVVNFYCAHGVFGTKGVPIAENKMGAEPTISQSVMTDLMNRMNTEKWSTDRLEQEILEAKASANSQGLSADMQIVESVLGRGFGNRQKVYNYTLAHDGPNPNDTRAENLWRTHQKSTAAVDLLIMKDGTDSNLANAVSFARSKGEKYTVFHFLPCRHIDKNDAKSMRTVTAKLDFGDGEFIETSIL